MCALMIHFPTDSTVIIILASVLGGMVLLFLLVGITICLWVAKKQKVGKAQVDVTTSSDAMMQHPVTNTYYDTINRVSTRSTSAVYDTVRREDIPEIVLTGSEGTIADTNLEPFQPSSGSTPEPPYYNTAVITSAAIQLPTEGASPPDDKLHSPYYSYVENDGRRVQLVQQKDGTFQQDNWVAEVQGSRRTVESWTGSEHVYI